MADEASYLKQVESGVILNNPDAVSDAQKALEDMQKQKQLELENQELQKKLFKIVNDNLRVLEPKNQYETVEEYWDIYKKVHANDFSKKMVEFEARLRQLDKVIKAREERVQEVTGGKK